ncbi:MAG: pyruvate dehydrogenase (acetyl-transferring), homodimeric type [Pseudomonadales bacterium]|nr:pyruvate dehydrogenase (acetyl-transferring), homodimeric type [Pseudomonadales bacterium]NRA16478.1 pyruvate dehydrogenase (acetyl-transferring), homodimeric type [Oceanospirillaceae bacterium]
MTVDQQTTAAFNDSDKLLENQEWLAALDDVMNHQGEHRTRELLRLLQASMLQKNIQLSDAPLNTPYRNTIPVTDQPSYPGNPELETQLENIIRWNAAAMVLKANDLGTGVGGHISTYQSAATMLEVGFNHIFKSASENYGGDQLMVQAHAAPGLYARAYLEGRLSKNQLDNFRRELQPGGGLSSYPHPRRMDDFWQGPTASMGLSTPSAIYQARFMKYLENRGLKAADGGKIWCFIGDGESDEPEVMGTINMATRDNLDNLVMVINCNLQRLDGPVRGNGKIIQELERNYRGAGWNVIKVIWGSEWDELFSRDSEGVLQARMDVAVDGDYQFYTVSDGETVRNHWIANDPRLEALMKTLSDEQIRCIKRGGHDRNKVYAAFEKALKQNGKPTVLLIKTVKGEGMGASAEGQNTAHQKKQMTDAERIAMGRRFNIPLDDKQLASAELYKPAEGSPVMQYLHSKRQQLNGYLPSRKVTAKSLPAPELKLFSKTLEGNKRVQSTTMAFVRMLSILLKDAELGKYIVPIVPDEARTFGMEALFNQFGIYSSEGQKYKPVDSSSLLPYKEAKDGQLLQEGICETGAMASFMAAGTAYANYAVPTIPFYIFYSMFGFQRVGDMIWACADSMAKGFLLGATAGRTTLNGEGLQHQDGHSQAIAATVPNLQCYDPAFGYELAIIIRDGIDRMYQQDQKIFYYITLYNENYSMPAMPEGVEKQVLQGMYKFQQSTAQGYKVHLLGSGSIIQEVLKAAQILETLGCSPDIWSVTSYTQLTRNAQKIERQNLLDPEHTQLNDIQIITGDQQGAFVAVSDHIKSLPNGIARWLPSTPVVLGTDGFGLSEARDTLRDYFEVDAKYIAWGAMTKLFQQQTINAQQLQQAREQLQIPRDKLDPTEV